jgi:D-sedoheptulose 7-phosphate isomerase
VTAPGEDLETLYPFLYAGATDTNLVLDGVRRSTAEKAREIVELRQALADACADALTRCSDRMAGSFRHGGRLFAFGNGGSSSDADQVAQLFLNPPAPYVGVPALSLTADVAVLTALANDVGFEAVFARQLAAFGHAGDIAVGLSTSGGSANVLRAFDEASRRGMITVGFAGYDGGRMGEATTIDHLFVVPSSSVHRIQEAQTTLYHVLWELTELRLAGSP